MSMPDYILGPCGWHVVFVVRSPKARQGMTLVGFSFRRSEHAVVMLIRLLFLFLIGGMCEGE